MRIPRPGHLVSPLPPSLRRPAPARQVGVCFADLVGFTVLGEQRSPGDLGRITDRLDHLVTDLVSAPVRLVKIIGDAVMMVAPDADALAGIALDLVNAARGEGVPPLRAGLAWGTAIHNGSEWFGWPVDLASGALVVASPHEILVTGEFYDELDTDEFWGEPAGTYQLDGIALGQELFAIGRRQVA